MFNKKLRLYIGVILPIFTLAAGTFYLYSHHALLKQLASTSPTTLISVFLLNILMIGTLILILDATLRICSKKLDKHENAFINVYSLLINFFVPGQSGPAFRGAYLKKKHRVSVKNFIAVTLLYYVFYGAIGVFLLVVGSQSWQLTLLASAVIICAIALAIYAYLSFTKLKRQELNLSPANVLYLVLASVMQAIVQIGMYSIELHSGNKHVGFNQVLAYTGAANLALFVALTPGAIGIRETFLLSTEKLHHISSGNIVIANVIDRSVYLIFLLALAVLLLTRGLRFKNKLNFKQMQAKIKLLDRSVASVPKVTLEVINDKIDKYWKISD